jgi:hypothetical protein
MYNRQVNQWFSTGYVKTYPYYAQQIVIIHAFFIIYLVPPKIIFN